MCTGFHCSPLLSRRSSKMECSASSSSLSTETCNYDPRFLQLPPCHYPPHLLTKQRHGQIPLLNSNERLPHAAPRPHTRKRTISDPTSPSDMRAERRLLEATRALPRHGDPTERRRAPSVPAMALPTRNRTKPCLRSSTRSGENPIRRRARPRASRSGLRDAVSEMQARTRSTHPTHPSKTVPNIDPTDAN